MVTLTNILVSLLEGAVTTVWLTIGTLIASFVLGMAITALAISRFGALRAIAYCYVQLFRCVPVITMLFIIYFGLPAVGIRLDSAASAIIGLSLGGAAAICVVLRGALSAVPKGQMEAAKALGMTRWMALWEIIMPQAWPVALAPLGNFAIGTLKYTSIASAVGAPEMTYKAQILVQNLYRSTEIYIALAGFYLLMSLPMARCIRLIERRLNRKHR